MATTNDDVRRHTILRGIFPCPACGDYGPHDDNGEHAIEHLSFACVACGEHVDADQALRNAEVLP